MTVPGEHAQHVPRQCVNWHEHGLGAVASGLTLLHSFKSNLRALG